MNKQNRNSLINTENSLLLPGSGAGKKGKGIKKYKLLVQDSNGEVKCSTGNIIRNILITTSGVRRARALLG